MAKKKVGRAIAGLAALGTIGTMAANASRRSKEAALDEVLRPSPPKLGGREKTYDELREDGRRKVELLRYAQGKPAVTPEEHEDLTYDIKGVRDSSGIPIKAGDGVLEESYPSVRPARASTPSRFMVDTPLEMKHFLGRDTGTLNPRDFKKGGEVKRRSSVSSASKRGDGIAIRGKTKGRML